MVSDPPAHGSEGTPVPADVAAAMWSVYYHSIYLPSLQPSIFERVQPLPDRQAPDRVPSPLPLQPLPEAIDVLMNLKGGYGRLRRLQALRKLGAAGLANDKRRDMLRQLATERKDAEYRLRVETVAAKINALVNRAAHDWGSEGFARLALIDPAQVATFIDELVIVSGSCAPVGATCSACFEPHGGPGGQPITTVVASAYVKRDISALARVLDPRAWQLCAPDAFEKSERVSCSYGVCTPVSVPSGLGTPWSGQLEEVVILGGFSKLQNWLNIDFTVNTVNFFGVLSLTTVRVDYSLYRSGEFTIPPLFIFSHVENVVVDEGYLLATQSIHPSYPAAAGWKYVKVVKRVRFVDLSSAGGTNPWGIDPGEVLNYWAPVLLSVWLESGTQGFLCCDPPN